MLKVSLKPLKGDTFVVEVHDDATVEELKKNIAEDRPEFAPPELQKLIYAGKVLADAETVKEACSQKGSVVIMLARAPASGAALEAGAAPAAAVRVAGLAGAAAPSYARETGGAAEQAEALEDRAEGPEDGLPQLPRHPSDGAVRNVVLGSGTWLRPVPGSAAARYWYRVTGEGRHRFVLATA
ncbi:unnamed protein product, partial [Prorocentrum cordatum]